MKLSELHDLVTQIATARSAIVSYDVQITAEVTKHGQLEADEDRVLWDYDLHLAVDQPNRRMHVSRREVLADLRALNFTRRGNNWEILIETPDWRMVRHPPHGATLMLSGARSGGSVEFFDPRALGLAFCGDFRVGFGFEKVIANYLQWPDSNYEFVRLRDGLVRITKRDQYFHLIVDTSKDYWPVEVLLRSGNTVISKTSVELVKVEEWWVPKNAKIECPDSTTALTLQWTSVNGPLAADLFDPQAVARQHTFRVSDSRPSAN